MKAGLSGLVCATAILLFIGISSAKAEPEFVQVPVGGPIFPPGSGPNVLDFSFTEEPDNIHYKILTFEGSIQNASFTNGASILFWFDWTDVDSTAHISGPEIFTLTPISPTGGGHSFEFFTRSYTIPYCPPEISVHFVNDTPGVTPGSPPVIVSGTFTYECVVPEPGALLILPVMVLAAPWAVRRIKALANPD